jgi:small-conductance mechanosensitive channel
MSFRRIALAAGIVVLAAFVYVVLAHGLDGGNALVVVIAVVALVGAGNLLYGKSSHGAAAQARVRPAQEARNRAIDEARLRQADHHAGPSGPEGDTAPE